MLLLSIDSKVTRGLKMSHFVPIPDIAKELGLSVPSAYRYVDGVSSIKDGRRRLYDLDQVKTVGIQKAKKATEPALDYSELGSSSVRRWGESIAEERLRALRGKEGRILLREMRLNDPVIAAVFLAIENSLRKVSWRVKPASESDADKECAEFVDQCHPAGTMILTPDGQKPIEEIRVGDTVYSHTGKTRKVTDIFSQIFSGDLYGFQVRGLQQPILVTPNHPLLVARGRVCKKCPKYSTSWLQASDIQLGDYLLEPTVERQVDDIEYIKLGVTNSEKLFSHNIPTDAAIPVTDKLCKLLGYYVAEGWTHDGNIEFAFDDRDTQYIEEVENLLYDRFGCKTRVYKNGRDSVHGVKIVATNAVASEFLKQFGGNAHEKHIPDWMMKLPKILLVSFLSGMINGDGHYKSACDEVSYCTVSTKLVEQVRFLFRDFGYVPSIRLIPAHQNTDKNGKIWKSGDQYHVAICGDYARDFRRMVKEQVVLEIEDIQRHHGYGRVALVNGYVFHKVKEVNRSPVTNLKVYNLEVEEDHSFLANNVSSHNCLNDMSFSFSDELQFILEFLTQGFSVLETVLKRRLGEQPLGSDIASSQYNDGRVGWRKWAPRPAESLASGKEWILDENGGIKGIRQDVNGKIIEIPIEKMLLFRTTVAPANSPEGLAIHRAAYTSWWYCNQIQEVEGIGIERDLAGIPVIYMGADTKKRGANSDFEQAKDIVTNLRNDEQAGVVFPYAKLGTGGDNRGILLELISTSGRRSYNSSAIVERYSKRIALSTLAQFIMLGMEAVGSYALGRLQADIFMLAVSAWATNIAETINRFAIPRLLKYNVFPGITGMPKIVPSDLGIPNLEELARYVNTLVGAGLLQPDNELERHLRQAANLPAKEEVSEEDQQQQPRAGATGERAILRATRASLLMNRLRLLQQQGILTPEQAAPLLERARQEILGALGELDTGEEITPTTAESASKPKTKPAESAGNLKDIEDVLARLEGKKR